MKKLLSFLSLFLIVIGSFAQSFTVGDLTYSVLSSTAKTVSVSNGKNATGDVVVTETVIYDDVEYSVTTIGSYAFDGNKNITSVNLPSVTSINSYAFYNCSSLASANLPSATSIGSYAFYNCSNISSLRIGSAEQWCKVNFGGSYSNPLQGTSQQVDLYIGESETPATSVELPSTVTEIPDCAFYRTNITSFSAPSVTSIGSYAFSGCSSLSSANLPSATSIGSSAFAGCESLEEAIMSKVEIVGENAFNYSKDYDGSNWHYHYCTSLKKVDLSSVVSIDNSAFKNCSNISSLRIGSAEQWCKVNFGDSYSNPLKVTSQQVDLYIGESETPATSVELPSTVTEIPNYAFYRTNITSFSAPSVTSIGSYAFAGCESLEEAIIPKAETLGEYVFGGYYDNGWHYHYCTSLKTVDLSSAVSIYNNAFQDCSNISSLRIGSAEQWCNVNFGDDRSNPLECTSQQVDLYIGDSETPATSVELPSTVTEIPNYAFRRTNITSFSAPSVTSIGSYAFQGCSSLASANLPSATSIGSDAFRNCSSLASLNLPSATSIGGYAFQSCSSLASANLPSATSIGYYAFEECYSLASIKIPAAETLGYKALFNCQKITHLELPEVKEIGEWSLGQIFALKYLSIPKVEKIGGYAFFSTNNIDTLRIGSTEQYCNIEYAAKGSGGYEYAFPLQGDYNKYIFIGDSETPATDITIPATVQRVPEYSFRGTSIHTIHFEGGTPPALISTNAIPTWTMLAVPVEAYETYLAADVYKTIPLQITMEGHLTKVVDMEADATTSKLLMKIGEDEIGKIINLTIKGSINSYDMMIIRNQMTSLRNLDLTDASIVDCNFVYSNADGINYRSKKDEITADWLEGLLNVKLPTTTKSIGSKAFYNCSSLVSVTIPDGVTSIGSYAFKKCI